MGYFRLRMLLNHLDRGELPGVVELKDLLQYAAAVLEHVSRKDSEIR